MFIVICCVYTTGVGACIYTKLSLPLKVLPDSVLNKRVANPKSGKYLLKTIYGLMVDGKRDCEEIHESIQRGMVKLKYAYSKLLSEQKGLDGDVGYVGFWFVINGSGKIVDCRIVETTVTNKSLQEVLLRTVKQMQFTPLPNAADITIVAYPYWNWS
jgi:hypothetical protein